MEQQRGGYRFLRGGSPFSAGVAALPGYRIERARFPRVVPLAEGMARIRRRLDEISRPPQALCGVELRSPAPFTYEGFGEFNQRYIELLAGFEIHVDGVNPVARTNVAPEFGAPPEPGVYAFSYTVPGVSTQPDFVIAGGGEIADDARGPEAIVRRGEAGEEALRAKARFVTELMRRRMEALGTDWSLAVGTRVYCVHDIHPLLRGEIFGAMGADAEASIEWVFARPPIVEIEFEMDVRRVAVERLLTLP